ncbi:Ankyrin-repeat and fibronectin type III domain-containing 1 [Entomortierella beljakovae]|nr:Ankyrin-repeat and fibronectin type III domain-containing 1 [Entomortierella beljakovae]
MATTSQIKITFQQDGRKQERIIDLDPAITCRQAIEQKSLELRTKSASYFESRPSTGIEPSKSSLRDSALLRGPTSPIDHHRLFNFFRTTDDQFVSKFQNGNIYLSLIILNSDNKILLSPSGLPPTVLISTVGGLANYYNFDSDSSDFSWMFKTTLDWASDPSANRSLRDGRQGAISPDKPPILSPPASRGSFTSRSKRGSISSATGPNGLVVNGVYSSIISQSSKLSASSISVDRSSIISDTSRQPSIYDYADRKGDYRGENSLRQDYVAAVEELQQKLGCPPIDLLYDRVVDLPLVGAKTVMAVQYTRDFSKEHIAPELIQLGSFRWRHIESVSNSVFTRKEDIWSQLTSYYDSVRVSRPSPGLYIGLYYTESTMSGLQILVPKLRRTFVPVFRLRDDSNLSPEEWEWMQSTVSLTMEELSVKDYISKDDPMYQLKSAFVQSVDKLSQYTQLKWDLSDMYSLDTLQVVMQERKEQESSQPTSRRMSQDSQGFAPISMDEQPNPLFAPVSTRSMVAMTQDPIWAENVAQDSPKSFRVIMFVKPTRHPTQPQETFNKQLFELCPFPIFDALHHSVYNTGTYHQLRKSMLQLTNNIVDLEIEMEQELELELAQLQKEKEEDFETKNPCDDDYSNNLSHLVDDLDIKSELPPTRANHAHQHPRHRSSFIGDDAIRGSGYLKRLSTSSLADSFIKSPTATSNAVTFAAPVVPTVPAIPTIGVDSPTTPMTLENFIIAEKYLNATRKGSIGPLQVDDNGDQECAPMPFLETTRESESAVAVPFMSTNINNNSNLSINTISSFDSTSSGSSSSDDEDDYTKNSYLNRQEYSLRRSSLGNRRPDCPNSLPPLPSLIRHRRSYSMVQAVDLRHTNTSVAAVVNGNYPGHSISSTMSTKPIPRRSVGGRSRTTSCSSYIHAFQQQQQQQPIYRNRYLSNGDYPQYLSQAPLDQNLQQLDDTFPNNNDINTFNNNNNNSNSNSANNENVNQYPAELAKLEQQQQVLQERWRLVSWTRQLNEWDHARMLKTQGDLLGIGMGVGMSLGINLELGMDMDTVASSTITDSAISNAAILQQNSGIPSPPMSISLSSLHSDEA